MALEEMRFVLSGFLELTKRVWKREEESRKMKQYYDNRLCAPHMLIIGNPEKVFDAKFLKRVLPNQVELLNSFDFVVELEESRGQIHSAHISDILNHIARGEREYPEKNFSELFQVTTYTDNLSIRHYFSEDFLSEDVADIKIDRFSEIHVFMQAFSASNVTILEPYRRCDYFGHRTVIPFVIFDKPFMSFDNEGTPEDKVNRFVGLLKRGSFAYFGFYCIHIV